MLQLRQINDNLTAKIVFVAIFLNVILLSNLNIKFDFKDCYNMALNVK